MSNLSTFKAPLISGPVGTHGSSSVVPVLTLDAKGRLSVSTSALSGANLSAFTNDAGFLNQAGVRNAISASGALAYNATTGVVSLSFDPATKASLNADVSFATVSTSYLTVRAQGVEGGEISLLKGSGQTGINGSAITIDTLGTSLRIFENGAPYRGVSLDFANCGAQSALYHQGNFDPSSKLDKSPGTITGQLIAKAGVAGTIASRSGDGSFLQVRADENQGAAAMTFHRSNSYATWFGLDTDNEFKFGGWSEGAASYRFWTSKNFNPASYAAQNTTPRFTSVYVGNSDALFYSDATNIRWRANTAAGGYKYAGLNDDGNFQVFNGGVEAAGDVHATGAVRANGRVIVGEGATASYIEMRDTDEGTRFIHNNSNLIGFLGKAADWIFRVDDGGGVWTKQFGDLNSRIESRADAFAASYASGRVSKTGDTMTGNLSIQPGSYPSINLLYNNVKWWGMQIRENGWLYFPEDNLATFNMAFVPGGNIWSNAFGGYLTDYINARTGPAVLDIRMTVAGNVGGAYAVIPNYGEPYAGAVATGMTGTASGTMQGLRFRYLQKLVGGNWYTCSYV